MTTGRGTTTYNSPAYLRGWNASDNEQANLISPMESPAMDAADERNECDEWYEGFSDHSQGHSQFHLRDCAACSRGEGYCAE